MSEDMRKRSPNWLSSEKELLLSLVEFHFNIIENKKTDGVTIKSKLAQQIIADQYNSRTSHCFRTAENLKAQWESMKKVARKDAANNRRHMIRTGGGSPLRPKKEDPFLQRILCLISTSAVGLFNPYDSDSIIPAVQDETAIPSIETEDFPEPLAAQYKDILLPPTVVIVDDQISETTVQHNNKDFVTKDWGDYTPQLLRTPVSQALKIDGAVEKNTPVTDDIANMIEKHKPNHETWISRRRPIHTNTSSSLELLHKKKIEAIELQKKHAVEKMERTKVLHDLDTQIKKQILRQEKIKTNLLLIKRRRLLTCRKSTK
ncbi:hypothetical protein evm_014290 [Chilo suppressalis]|nr:hypothetical protein evm_014290 [Chilo suppressalis]